MVESTTQQQILVLDIGTNSIKAGFAGEISPRCEVPTVLGRSNKNSIMSKVIKPKPAIGAEALKNRDILTIKNPIKNGVIENWEELEEIIHFTCFNELQIDPAECIGVVFTQAPNTSKFVSERMATILFDLFAA